MNFKFQGIEAVPVKAFSTAFRVRNPYSFIYLPWASGFSAYGQKIKLGNSDNLSRPYNQTSRNE